MIEFELPYPPSVNSYYRSNRGRVHISGQGKAYREIVCAMLRVYKLARMAGRLAMEVDVYPPDRRARDIDNVQKCLLDSVQHAGVYEDDSQIDDLHIRRREVDAPRGKVVVRIREIEGLGS